jgi:DNA polymerase-3 subunit delta
MRITTEQLAQHLGRGIEPLYTVFGDEPLLALEACDRIRAAVLAEGGVEREVLVAESSFKWGELALAASSQSLFAPRKLLELRIPNGKPGVDGGAAIQSYCERLPPETVTAVELPALDWRAQKAAWFSALESTGVVVEARAVTRAALPRWIAGRLKAQKQQADGETLAFIADRVEGNLMAAYQEVQKLALLYPAGTVTHDQVREAVLDVARYDVFALGELMLEGDRMRLTRVMEALEGEAVGPPLVLWALTEEIRALGRIIAGVAAGKPLAALMRDNRIRGASHQSAMQSHCRQYSPRDVSEGIRHAAAIDRMIKGLDPGDVWNELLRLGLRFCRPVNA